jgi:phage tail protein X
MAASILSPAEFAAAYNLSATASNPVIPQPVVRYVTRAGDRWDLISWNIYGDPTQISILIQNNLGIPIRCTLPQGLVVVAPLIPQPQQVVVTTPWQP